MEPTDTRAVAGRLAPIADLVGAARNGAADLITRLENWFDESLALPPVLRPDRVAVWHDTGLFAISAPSPPALSLDGAEALPMTALPGTPFYSFRYLVDSQWSDTHDVAGYNPLSYELPDLRRGRLSEERTVPSRIYPGATTHYWLRR
jgi:hypothetical protein